MALPEYWLDMSMDALWNYLNDPERHPTPKASYDATVRRERRENAWQKEIVANIVANMIRGRE